MLRDDLIEAMAQPIADEMYDVPQYHQEREYVAAANALDAILDVLEANVDLWCESSDDTKMLDRGIPIELIAALRPPVSSSQDSP